IDTGVEVKDARTETKFANKAGTSVFLVTGGKSLSEYMFSELPQIADIVRSRYTIRRTHSYRGSRVLGPSNSMLGGGPTTPQDYPEKTGFARRRERECGHGRHWADTNRRPSMPSEQVRKILARAARLAAALNRSQGSEERYCRAWWRKSSSPRTRLP